MARMPGKILFGILLLVLMAGLLTGCGGKRYSVYYPEESLSFPDLDGPMPKVYASRIRDLRPDAEREGRGFFSDMNYPADDGWNLPVTEIYGDALVQDLDQTHLVEIVPLRAQADYVLEVDLLSFTSRIDRSVVSMLLPVALGVGTGMLVSEDSSHGMKLGAVIGGAAFIGLPMPVDHTSSVEARLRLLDQDGEVVWEEICLGETKDRIAMTAVDRRYQRLLDKHLVRAIKKCNACLTGQLRQQFMTELP